MTASYTEQDFEEHIEQHLLASGYAGGVSSDYDQSLCPLPEEVMTFITRTQHDTLNQLAGQYGEQTREKLLHRLSYEISKRGTLDVLRKGIKDRGCTFHLVYFKPASGLNPEHHELYAENRLTVVRQLYFSEKTNKSIDIVLFLNGLPIVTAELKNALTGQYIEQAIKQYKEDRSPSEPLLRFKRCLVHFAVSTEKVAMTTRLRNDKTTFLPFNLDTENPNNPSGHKTAYLWENILQPDSLLDLVNNYVFLEKQTSKHYDKDKGLVETETESFIFPRYHQLDVVRNLLDAVREEGTGRSYLVQHSAGSGKSNSIAWLAHQLAGLYQHTHDEHRLFDSIIVVTDRRVLDRQLQNTIKQFEQTSGVVVPIDKHSGQLREALQTGKAIIVSTLQKFSVIYREMSDLKGQKFAVIVDEAHTSQGGESAKHLKEALTATLEDAEEQDEDLFDIEDEILREIELRGRQPHISYFAFTATPKSKTLELFGRPGPTGKSVAFHIYSMRQAIEEDFILDVLKNYTTFKRYFKLMKTVEDDPQYERRKTIRLLTSYVDLQPHAIDQKCRLMLEHFLDRTVHAIQGRGRAMVVTRSRLHAVKYYIKFRAVMDEMHLPYKPLVAFSGTVNDPDTGGEFTENSLNGLPPRVSIPDAFKTPDYRILIVAEKFQTGFDEPLLHTMYVDKKLSGVHAVQTLSRLNRTMPGKDECLVLDFVNEADKLQEAFQDYYQTTLLEEETDPNILYDLQSRLQDFEIYTDQDIAEFAAVFFDPGEPMELLQPILNRARDIWRFRPEDEREDFRSLMQRYNRLYGFISQIITFKDADLEKLYIYMRNLNRKLDKRESTLPTQVLDAVDLDSFRIQQTFEGRIELEKDDAEISGVATGGGKPIEDELDILSHIVADLNELYGIDLSEEDKLDIEKIQERVEAHEGLRTVATADNSVDDIKMKFNEVFDQIILDFVHTKLDLYKKLSKDTSPRVNAMLKERWFGSYLAASKRAAGRDKHQVRL